MKDNVGFDSDFENWVIQFLTPIAIDIDNPDSVAHHFAEELFKFGMYNDSRRHQCPDYIFLFDAYDELEERHQNKAISLFRFLISRNFTLWITSRPHKKSYLEKELQTSALYINLLTADQKKEYFSAHHANSLNKVPYEVFYSRVESTILLFGDSSSQFDGYPLHLQFLTNFKKFDLLLNLILRLISYKINLYEEKNETAKIKLISQERQLLHDFHSNLALANFRDITHPISSRMAVDKFAIGLVTLENEKLSFIHPLIKAYFVACYVANTSNLLGTILSEERCRDVRFVMNSMNLKNLKLENIESKSLCNMFKVANIPAVIKMLTEEKNKKLAKLVVSAFFEFYKKRESCDPK
ncbi:hypothetical protein GWI33_001090 [Rhynchophorus ferrugineus]|uniref:NACHT domain-containing protein n=1 Tax=Rhynchophorus ferrugineus TaxID=354439 RepID=A0A834IM18_RHYFE|nr:hypothetical protein GWI33_001090 [Rhynchophorus ferrugineus]